MSENQSLMLQEAGQSPEVVATLLEKEKPVFAEIARLFSSARPSVVTTAARGFTIANSFGRKERSEIFRAGLETRAGRIPLPAKFLPLKRLRQATEGSVLACGTAFGSFGAGFSTGLRLLSELIQR